jgi:hypothetical protein
MTQKTPPPEYLIDIPSAAVGTTTTATRVHTFGFALNPAPPVDNPLVTVEYESWMFFETTRLTLNHWKDFPNVVVRHAIVEDAVLHARSLCEVIFSEKDDLISLRMLIPDYDETAEEFKILSDARGQLSKEYRGRGRKPTYEKLFQTRVMHPTVLRGEYGIYEEPLRRLAPKILAVVREIARLTKYPFRLPLGNLFDSEAQLA